MNRKKFLLGRPVVIASHAGPAHRGRVGELLAVAGNVATVRLKTPRWTEDVAVPLQGLWLIYRPGKAPSPQPHQRSFISGAISRIVQTAFARPAR